jgi:hypothetical protein
VSRLQAGVPRPACAEPLVTFMKPGIEPHGVGREMVLLDPASNQLRFFERARRHDEE